MNAVQLVECPRDAMQGINTFIETEQKIAYINSILKCGFDTVDFGSFVSPKAIPQMRDTEMVLEGLDLSSSNSKLLAIVANVRGAEDAMNFEEISYIGFPFSISETFQQRNANSSISQASKRVEELHNLCLKNKKTLVVYISMAFGNPYGDVWNPELVLLWMKHFSDLEIKIISLADTIGVSTPESITQLFSTVIPEFTNLTVGAHLHTTPSTWNEKMIAAWDAGCRRYDHAVKGFGGCPLAIDQLTGNMPTEKVLEFLTDKNIKLEIDRKQFDWVLSETSKVFGI